MELTDRLQRLKKISIDKGGLCLSDTYVNNHTKLLFKCSNGHQWSTVPTVILAGSWCKKCASKKANDWKLDTITTYIKIAESKGGKCLSDTYINSQNKLLFECKYGHQWLGRPQGVKRGNWCRKCYGTAKSDIQEMKNIATERGGLCLSTEYISDAKKLKWQCSEGHTWEATPNNIKHDKWCPICSEGLGERICRLFFQKIFGFEFIKVRPDWLTSSKGFPLELDGYCEELKLAFEHQGRQHYKTISMYSKRKHYDEEKRVLCGANNVRLIEIPEILTDTKIKDLKQVIVQECFKQNISIPTKAKDIEITPYEIFTYTKTEERRRLVERAKIFIEEKDAKLLDTNLSDNGIYFKVECKEKHQWNILSYNLFKNKWCPKCAINDRADKKRGTIEEMQEIAKSRGGICLSNKYISSQHKLKWECANKHQWLCAPNKIKSGSWCLFCSGSRKWNKEDVFKIIESKNGKCLTKDFTFDKDILKVKCKFSHEFKIAVKDIKHGNWCRKCAIEKRAEKRRLTIDDMHELAKKKGGKCLSKVYKSSHTSLLWECSRGHSWEARPSNVKHGTWCPFCPDEIQKENTLLKHFEKVVSIAKRKNGKCLSKSITDNKVPLEFKCKKGHIWKTRASNILAGHWCASCSNSENQLHKKTTIQEVKILAQTRGGDCLSKEYKDSLTKLTFKCAEGHTWTALWSNIKHKNCWCPTCAAKTRWDIRRQKKSNYS